MRVGVHVSIAGGLGQALERAKRLSCNTMQIFSRSPRGGPAPIVSPDELRQFQQQRLEAGIEPLAVHAPYIINLASPVPVTYANSLALYREEYARCCRLGAHYLVTHVGSHRGAGEEAGIEKVASSLARTLEGYEGETMILLENTAGSGQGLGYAFEQLAAMRAGVKQGARIGICLDTAHLFASGFAIHTAEGLDETLQRFDRVIGLKQLKLIHLNDSKVPFNSHVDRHWHIGQGEIGLEAMRRIVTHPQLRNLPFILETPKDSDEDDPRNLGIVRGFAHETGKPAKKKSVKKA